MSRRKKKRRKQRHLINKESQKYTLPQNFQTRKLREIEKDVVEKICAFFQPVIDQLVHAAWYEYHLSEDITFDTKNPEFPQAFFHWFLFYWLPADIEEIGGLLHKSNYDQPLAISFLNVNRHNLNNSEIKFIKKSCNQHYSFYAVKDVIKEQGILLHDIFLKKDIFISEYAGSKQTIKGNILFTRVLSYNNMNILIGCAPYPISSNYHTDLLDFRDMLLKEMNMMNFVSDDLYVFSQELRKVYFNIIERQMNPELPELQNTDGDKYHINTIFYDLGCSPQEAFNKLEVLCLFENEEDKQDLLNEFGEYNEQGNLISISFKWFVKGNKIHKTWDNTILGNITIDNNELIIEVNSDKRAKKIKKLIKKLLKKDAKYRNTEFKSTQDLMNIEESELNPEVADDDIKNNHEVQKFIEEQMNQYYKDWLDNKIPALNNKTPRQSAKTESGRERLEALFLQFEEANSSSRQKHLIVPIDYLKKELGMK